jgi:hypothetical protein
MKGGAKLAIEILFAAYSSKPPLRSSRLRRRAAAIIVGRGNYALGPHA